MNTELLLNLARDLGSQAIRELDEQTVALSHNGRRQGDTLSIDAPRRLIGYQRQELVQMAFEKVANAQGLSLERYACAPGAPTVSYVPGEGCNLTHFSLRQGRPVIRKHKTLAAIAAQPLPHSSFVADLFGSFTAFNPSKPLAAWLVYWRNARSEEAELPLWTGFRFILPIKEEKGASRAVRRVAVGDGISYADALKAARDHEDARQSTTAAGSASTMPLVHLRRTTIARSS